RTLALYITSPCTSQESIPILSVPNINRLLVRFARCDYRSIMIVHVSTMVAKRSSRLEHQFFVLVWGCFA
ncbi:hypothetical protein SK128_004966, partial [Halocaridina rubra]